MRRFFLLVCFLALSVGGVGCNTQEDPRERPDFVDTTDPSKAAMPEPPQTSNPTQAPAP